MLLCRIATAVIILVGLLLQTPAMAQNLAAATPAKKPPPGAGVPAFDTDILPILREKCLRCHGETARKGDLDLRTVAAMLRGGESGPGIVASHPDKSLLLQKVKTGAMPPAKKDALSPPQVLVLERWIAAGAAGATGQPANGLIPPNQHDIIPIMLRRCSVCHGGHRQEAGLDLRTRAGMLRGGKSGPALVAGNPDASRMLQKVQAGQMPPHDRLVEVSVKPMEGAETDLLARWIALGAPEVAIQPDIASTVPDPLVSDKDRDFWAFRAPRPAQLPDTAKRVASPVDAFILQGLEARGLGFAPEADRATLLRRASFDLTGMPPEPAELAAFVANKDPQAYRQMIDRLLASPRYGERWGRYWLDAAGYADSEGKREQDLPRPYAWRYRDYVIRAMNADKPYDRFLLEQIAGDELADYEHAPEITPEIHDNLVATGFLRMVPDATWANITGYVPDRMEVIADEIDVLGSAVLGLTLKCARCHTHKFDPIPHRDYFRLLDIFKGALDEHDWLKPEVKPGIGPLSQDTQTGRHLPFVTTPERRAWEKSQAEITREVAGVKEALEMKRLALFTKIREKELALLPPALAGELRTLLATPPEKRSEPQRLLATQYEKRLNPDGSALKAFDPGYLKVVLEAQARLDALEAKRQPEPRVQALWDRGRPSPTYIHQRGDPMLAGRLVGPGVPSVLTDGKTPFAVRPPWPGARQTGRRLAFARWLTSPGHPLTARVAVNRIWKHHFGAGIVRSLGNFGKAGTPPTHPALLDWLALEYERQGWSLKAMHRLIMNSATYRQSSALEEDRVRLDPDNSLLSRMPMVRLDAEALYDTMLLVAGRLNETPYGPGDKVQGRPDGLITPTGTGAGWRRLVYVRQARKQIATHLENFDFPQMNPNCLERGESMVAPQALHLLNNAMVFELAGGFAKRLAAEPDRDRQISLAHQIALSRPPTPEEVALGVAFLGEVTAAWARQPGGDPLAAGHKALTSYCHALLNSAGFLYVD